MDKIRFGPSGNSESFYADGLKSTEQMPKWLTGRGLDAFEYSFGRGVNMGDEKAASIGKSLVGYDIEFSVHAPYYINLANPEEENAKKSYDYIVKSAQKLRIIGGERVIFHAASVGKMKRADAVALTLRRMSELSDILDASGLSDMIFCPETMGKHGQIGTIEEVVAMCKIDKKFIPCVDFGHINSFTLGGLKTYDDYRRVIDVIFEGLGEQRAKNIHVHFSKIEYSSKGEIRHLTLEDTVFGPEFEPLSRAIHDYNMTPVIISESAGVQAEDAAILKNIYNSEKCL